MTVQPAAESPPQLRFIAGLVLVGLLAFACFRAAPVTQVFDSAFALLVTERLLESGRVNLDGYMHDGSGAASAALRRDALPYQLREIDGSIHYVYPVGSSVLSLPMFALARMLGHGVLDQDGRYSAQQEHELQRLFAAVLGAATVMLLGWLAAQFGSRSQALLVALAVAGSTPILSSLTRGLWNQTWCLLLVTLLVALLTTARVRRPALGLAVGLLCVVIAITRPAALPSLVATATFVCIVRDLRLALLAAVGALAGILVAVMLNLHWYGSPLPIPTYLGPQFAIDGFLHRIASTLVAPSRGLLIFMPMAAIAVVAWLARVRRIGMEPLDVAVAVALAGQLALFGLFTNWWGGDSYGPRLWAESLPWLLVALLRGLSSLAPAPRRLAIAFAVPAIAWATLVHVRGAVSHETAWWNTMLRSVSADEAAWDIRYPQFLAGLVPRPVAPQPDLLASAPAIEICDSISLLGDAPPGLLGHGWFPPEPALRWTLATDSDIYFSLVRQPREEVRLVLEGAALLQGPKLPRQQINLYLNGSHIGVIDLTLQRPGPIEATVSPERFASRNHLRIRLDAPVSPEALGMSADHRPLGYAARSLVLEPAGGCLDVGGGRPVVGH